MLHKTFDLISPLARDECVRRLQANAQSWWFPFSNKPVAGYVGDTSFRIRKQIPYGNPFQPHLSGDLLDEGGRTRVRCDLGIRLAAIAFMAFWFGAVAIGGGTVAMRAIRSGAPADAWLSIAALAFMLGGGAVFVGLGLLSARNERRFLIASLRDSIAAREA